MEENTKIVFYILCFEEVIKIITNSQSIENYITSLKKIHVFPLSQIKNYNDNEEKQIPTFNIIDDIEQTSCTYDKKNLCLRLKIQWDKVNSSGTLETLIYQLTCLSAIENHRYILHASCVSFNENTLLIVGASGAGKTSLSISLCLNHKFYWHSNDQVKLALNQNYPYIITGKDFIDFRKLSFNSLSKHIPNSVSSKISSRFVNDNPKTSPSFYAEDLGLKIGSFPKKITHLLFINLLDNVNELEQRATQKYISWALSQDIARIMRGAELFILDNNGFILAPSVALEPNDNWEDACRFINSIYDNCKCYNFYGSLNSAEDYIFNILS